MAAAVHAALLGYRAFAPPEWSPPAASLEVPRLRAALELPSTWATIAESEGVRVGHALLTPARSDRLVTPPPGCGHLMQLFVEPAWWGRGVAGCLLAAAVSAARTRGYSCLRLFTPAAHGRARRFYQREGWDPTSGPLDDPEFGLPIVEYRRGVP